MLTPLVRLLHAARAPLGVLVATLAAVSVPSQSRDMVSGLWRSEDWIIWPALGMNLTLFLLGFLAWHWTRAALAMRSGRHGVRRLVRFTAPLTAHHAREFAEDALPRGLFLAAAATGAILYLRTDASTKGAFWHQELPTHMIIWAVWLAGSAFVLMRTRLPRWAGGGDRTLVMRDPAARGRGGLKLLLAYAPLGPVFAEVLLVLAVLAFLASLALCYVPVGGSLVAVPVWLGQVFPGPGAALFCLALMIGPLTALTAIFSIGWKRFVPSLAVASVLVWYGPEAADLHGVRIMPGVVQVRPGLHKMWQNWAQACAANADPESTLHPVIVAVSGGASRAGLWAARVLSRADELARAQHGRAGIFAISSVSGGSLGAAAFLAWTAGARPASPCAPLAADTPKIDQVMKDSVGHDALGPLLAGALISDVPRALFGVPDWLAAKAGIAITPPRGSDRAAALETGFEHNWAAAAPHAPPLGHGYLELYAAAPAGTLPLWIANGTDVAGGERLLTVPFAPPSGPFLPGQARPAAWPFDDAKSVLDILHADMPLSAVIDNTSRFPVLSPSGELDPQTGPPPENPLQIIDGGYFENEGLQTAMELADWLRNQSPFDGHLIDPIIVQATADADSTKLPELEQSTPRCSAPFADFATRAHGGGRPDQLSAPLTGVLSVRGAHTQLTLRQALGRYCRMPSGTDRFSISISTGIIPWISISR